MSLREFIERFDEEHRRVRDIVLELSSAIKENRLEDARRLLSQLDQLAGPHFRYEEEALYTALVQILGRDNVKKLIDEHDEIIETAHTLSNLLGKDRLSDEEREKAFNLARSLLYHVAGCNGLIIFVEKLAEPQIRDILRARERAFRENLPLTKWATTRKKPQL